MGELLMVPIELIQRGGKPAGVAAILVGLGLVGAGWWLAFAMLGPGVYWPLMLGVSALGLCLAGAGLAALFGTQAQLSGFEASALPSGRAAAIVAKATIPFWVCGACKIVREGVSMTERCEECGSMVDYMTVDEEADRQLAVGLLS